MSIGSHGATFKVRDDWRRKQLAANVGRDQFKLNSRKEYYAVLTESLQLLEGEEELAKAVRTLMPEITNQPLPRGQPRYSQLADGSERVTQVLEGSHSGIRLAYTVSLISRAGLTYRLMVWAEQANAREVERLSDRLIDGFSMPKAGTDWRRSTRPTTRTAVVGGHELTFRYRPSVFSPTEDDILVGLVSADREHAIYVLEMDASDADDQLDSVLSAINEGEPAPFKEQSRQDFTAGTVQGRMLTAYDGGLTSLLIALPLERERSLDIRYMFSGKPDAVRFDRDLFLESLKLAGVDVGLELPEIPKQPDDSYRNPQEQEVERISDLIAQTSLPSVNAAARLKDGRLLLTHGRGLTELKGDVERVVIESGQWGRQFSVASFDGGLVVADAADKEGKLLNGEGEGSRAGVAATLVAGWGNRLLYVPPVPDSKLVGFSGEPSSRTREVRCLQPDGGSRAVARLDGYQLTAMAAAADRDAAVVAATPLHRADRTWDQQRPVLLKLDLQTGESKVIAEWETVSCVAPVAGAWLVTGTPLKKAPGVYLLRDDGETSALVTGEAYVGAAVEGGRLWYTRSTTTDEGERQAVYSAPLKKLANVGPLCAPYCVESVNQTARRWADAGESSRVIATEPQVRAAFAAASRQCEAGLGVPLPTEGRGVDQMIQPLIGEEGLSHDAMQLVAVVLAHCLLEQGAEWVPSERGELVDWLAAGAEFRENAFAQGHTPASLLTDTLFNSDGYWAPGERIVENASGRHVFIGLDPRSVSEAVRQAEPPGVAERLASGEADRVIELLNLAPQNKYFRESAYRQLAATSDYRLVRDVADHFVRGDHPEDFDTTAWLSARHGLVDAGGIDPRLANDLIAAINDHPEESVLYVLLGMVCEGDPQRGVGQSRLCYSRALELNSWGAASDQAQERLDAIDAQAVKPAAPN